MPEGKEIIEQKISTLLERTERLKKFKEISFNEFSENVDIKDIVERNLQVAIETVLT